MKIHLKNKLFSKFRNYFLNFSFFVTIFIKKITNNDNHKVNESEKVIRLLSFPWTDFEF